MSATTAEAAAPLSIPVRLLRPPVQVSIRLVMAWHLVAALAFAWIAYNIFAAVWELESLPRTVIGIGAIIGIVANLGAVVCSWRDRTAGRAWRPSRSTT